MERTICNCYLCKLNCKTIPGYLIPTDLLIISKHFNYNYNILKFTEEYLLASPGAIVQRGDKIFRIHTLVPRRNEKGYCIFFTEDEKCSIHEISPFGCRYFDHSQTKEEADKRSKIGLNSIMEVTTESQVYKSLIYILVEEGLISPAPEILKEERKINYERKTN